MFVVLRLKTSWPDQEGIIETTTTKHISDAWSFGQFWEKKSGRELFSTPSENLKKKKKDNLFNK